MEKVSLTTLRQNIFRLADKVLKTRMPIVVERKGQKLILAPETTTSKLDRLKKRRLVKGKPELLVDVKVCEWHELKNLG
jgi:PIN domain nuclease of toxin-antitoxin system